MIPQPETLRVADVISNHVQRDFGSSGVREVALDVFNGKRLSFSYRIIQVWQVTAGSCCSLLLLTRPASLSGTAVKIVEKLLVEDLEIWLCLRSATKPLRVHPTRSNQYVLGTDFTYDDLRFWLPTACLDIRGVKIQGTSEKTQYVLSAKCKEKSNSDIHLVLDAKWLPIKIDWINSKTVASEKIYQVEKAELIEDVWTPTVISISRPREQYKSVMTLCNIRHRIPIHIDMFQTKNLAHLNKISLKTLLKNAQT